ncbi:hypothetical protein E2C01_059951 [Portunus trituberculatus]|uniref:Uncharacterized protein n=1 Tax=Portunus trituberculatus TaxID=210409 RepID=A0A5B7H792_PORTR|nr:hypothetical protein [Portunus trituberculatus]
MANDLHPHCDRHLVSPDTDRPSPIPSCPLTSPPAHPPPPAAHCSAALHRSSVTLTILSSPPPFPNPAPPTHEAPHLRMRKKGKKGRGGVGGG